MKGCRLPFVIGQIELRRQQPFELDRVIAVVDELRPSGDDVTFRIDAVMQLQYHRAVLEREAKVLCRTVGIVRAGQSG